MSVPLAVCSSVSCVSPTALLLGPMTVFGSIFRAWPSPAVPQILGGVGAGEYEKETLTDKNQFRGRGTDPGDRGWGGSRGQGHIASCPLAH